METFTPSTPFVERPSKLVLIPSEDVLDKKDEVLSDIEHAIHSIAESNLPLEEIQSRVAEILEANYREMNHAEVADGIIHNNIRPFENYLAQRDEQWKKESFESVKAVYMDDLRKEINDFISQMNVKTLVGTYCYEIPEGGLHLECDENATPSNDLNQGVEIKLSYQVKAKLMTPDNATHSVEQETVGLDGLLPEIDHMISRLTESKISDRLGIKHFHEILAFEAGEHLPAQAPLKAIGAQSGSNQASPSRHDMNPEQEAP